MTIAGASLATASIARTAAAQIARRLAFPTAAAAALAAWLAWADPSLARLGDDALDATIWRLHVPSMIVTCFASLALLDVWPTASRGRRDALWLARDLGRPWRGFVAAGLGMLLALAGALAIVGAVFALIGADTGTRQSHAHAFVALAPSTVATPSATAHFSVPSEVGAIDALVIRGRPRRTSGEPLRPAEFRVALDHVELDIEPLAIWSAASRYAIELTPRTVTELRLVPSTTAAPRVEFPAGFVEVRRAQPKSRTVNIVLAALTYLAPAALAIACLCLLQRRLATQIAALLILGIVCGATLLDLTPNARAIDAAAQGRWLPATDLVRAAWPLAAVLLAALLAAAFTQRTRRLA